jgi:hypothetical protein
LTVSNASHTVKSKCETAQQQICSVDFYWKSHSKALRLHSWDLPQRLKPRWENWRPNCKSGAEIHKNHEVWKYIKQLFLNKRIHYLLFIGGRRPSWPKRFRNIQRPRMYGLRCGRILNEKRWVCRLLCRFLVVLMPVLVWNHSSVKLMLTVQAHIYDIANRNEMIVLVMQNMEVWILWTVQVSPDLSQQHKSPEFLRYQLHPNLGIFILELYGLRQGCSSCRLSVWKSPEVTNC